MFVPYLNKVAPSVPIQTIQSEYGSLGYKIHEKFLVLFLSVGSRIVFVVGSNFGKKKLIRHDFGLDL